MNLHTINQWVMGLSANYNVNPYIFAAIYVGAIPFFTASVAWIIRNIKRDKPITLPVLSTGFWFSSAYLYLLIFGDHVPVWVYVVIFILIGYGIYSTYHKIAAKKGKILQ